MFYSILTHAHAYRDKDNNKKQIFSFFSLKTLFLTFNNSVLHDVSWVFPVVPIFN